MVFKEWLKTCKITDSPRGHFIADALRLKDFPDIRRADDLELLLAHMRTRGACAEAIRQARSVFRYWVQVGEPEC